MVETREEQMVAIKARLEVLYKAQENFYKKHGEKNLMLSKSIEELETKQNEIAKEV